MNPQLAGAVESVLGTGDYGLAQIRKYDALYYRVIPEIERSALAWATATLSRESTLLEVLRREVAEPAFAAWMRKASHEIVRLSERCRREAADNLLARGGYSGFLSPFYEGLPPSEVDVGRESCIFDAAGRFASSEGLTWDAVPVIPARPEQRRRHLEILQVLQAAPKTSISGLPTFADIIEAFARSESDGITKSHLLISQAAGAVSSFSTTLATTPGHAWRYPALILGGIRQLGLDDIDGFQEYAVGIAQIRGSRSPAGALNIIGVGLLVVGFVAGGVGPVVAVRIGLLDLATGSARTFFSYAREREQEFAVQASVFLPDESKFATQFNYDQTGLSISFMLIAAMSLSASFKGAWGRGEPPTPPPRGARLRSSPDPPLGTAPNRPPRARIPERERSFAGPETGGGRRVGDEARAAASGDSPGVPGPKSPKPTSPKAGQAPSDPATGGAGKAPVLPIVPQGPPRAVLDYVENLRTRFPGLAKANLRPIPRELSGSGLYEESMRTGGGRWSFEADFEGGTIQLDDITPEGVITDTKLRDTGRTIGREPEWRPPERGESIPRDVYDVITGKPPAKPPRWKDIELIRETYGPQLARQVRFADQNGLNGVVWETNREWMYEPLKKIIRDYDFVDRFPRMSIGAQLRP